jgi:hypothetical protein
MIPKATKSYAMEDPAPGEGPAAGGEALKIRRTPAGGNGVIELEQKLLQICRICMFGEPNP